MFYILVLLFNIQGDEMYRTSTDGTVYQGYPTKISVFWENVPEDVTAVFESGLTGLIYFVKGNSLSYVTLLL